MRYKVIIPGRMSSLNQYIDALKIRRGRWSKGGDMKKADIEMLVPIFQEALKGITVHTPIRIEYTFYEQSAKRDLDNIAGYAHKCIQDALQEAGIIPNDSWGYVTGFTDNFYISKDNPRIVVELIEVESEG